MVYTRALRMGLRCLLVVVVFCGALGMNAPSRATSPVWAVDAFDPFPDSTVHAIAVQPDGKILIGGFFTQVDDGPRSRIARLHSDGSLDLTFNPGASGPTARALAVDSDGMILVAGELYMPDEGPWQHIRRLYPDGSLDESFAPAPNGWVNAVALQSDGKIVMGGHFTSLGGEPRTLVGRLHPDGTLDASFDTATDGPVYTVAIQTDGKILIGGEFSTVNGVGRANVARLHSDGSLDDDWDVGADGVVLAIAPQPDGSILLGGAFASVDGQPRRAFARVTPQGALDSALDLGLMGGPYGARVFSIITDADGRIMLGGMLSWLPDGAMDHLANLAVVDVDGGLVDDGVLHVDGPVMALALQADGSLLVGGQFSEIGRAASRWCMGRLSNPTPAVYTLAYDESAGVATWARSGSGPEVWRTTLEVSIDGVNYTSQGEGVRTETGWAWEDLLLMPGRDLWLRVRGYHATGSGNGSVSIVEEVKTLHLEWDPILYYVTIALP